MTITRYTVQCRSEVRGDTLYGMGVTFAGMARVPGGYEQYHERAFDEVLGRADTDVVSAVEHDLGRILGRQSAGTMRVKVTGEGLAFEVDLDDTPDAVYVRSKVARGELGGASIGFVPGEDEWSRTPDGTQLRTIKTVAALRDISVVAYPAHDGAAIALRNYNFDQPTGRSQMVRARARVLLNGRD